MPRVRPCSRRLSLAVLAACLSLGATMVAGGVAVGAEPVSGTTVGTAAGASAHPSLREILRESRQFNAREFRILAAQVVIDLFLEDESQSLAMLEDFIGKPVSIQAESSYSQEQFDIVLL